MDKFEFALIVPKCLTTDMGINEDTMFEAYYEDGAIHIKEINETDIQSNDNKYNKARENLNSAYTSSPSSNANTSNNNQSRDNIGLQNTFNNPNNSAISPTNNIRLSESKFSNSNFSPLNN